MDSEKTYRVEHIFRPLTTQDIDEYKQKLIHLEKQFLNEVEKCKSKKNESSDPKIQRDSQKLQ